MKRITTTIIGTVLACGMAWAQAPDSLLFYEPTEDGNYRFYFDDRYYLADRDCEFVSIERDGGYHPATKTLDGPFVDYALDGRVLLAGQYANGKKEGQFQAFHATGQLKWEATFQNDMPTGEWKFYYPDGMPLYVFEYRADGLYIRDYWDNRGRQRVSDGKGRFEVTLKLDGYQEHGYEFIRRRGRVVGGKPHGAWIAHYMADGKAAMESGFEQFANGKFVRGMDTYTDEWYTDSSRLPFLPTEPFIRAELLAGKACGIDAYSGFLPYLKGHLESYFDGYDEELHAQPIEYVIELGADGLPRKASPVRTFPRRSQENELTQALLAVPFWFPTYADGEYVADRLTVTAAVFPDIKERKLRFFDVAIKREKGF